MSAKHKVIYMHDYSAVAYLLTPHLYTTRSGPVRVVTSGIAVGHTIQKPSPMAVPVPVPAPEWDDGPSREVSIGASTRPPRPPRPPCSRSTSRHCAG